MPELSPTSATGPRWPRTHASRGAPRSRASSPRRGSPLAGGDETVQVFGSSVTEDFFRLLGVEARIGRTFLAEDFAAAAEPVVILSHSLWSRQFGADPGLVGRTVRLDGETYTVVGVLPRQIFPLTAWMSGRLEFNLRNRSR